MKQKIEIKNGLVTDSIITGLSYYNPSWDESSKLNLKDYAKLEFVQIGKDTFMLNNLHNFKSIDTTVKKYGYIVYSLYNNKSDFMFLQKSKDRAPILQFNNMTTFENQGKRNNIQLGDLFTKEEMENIIKKCKRCGECFGKAFAEAQKYNKKTVIKI